MSDTTTTTTHRHAVVCPCGSGKRAEVEFGSFETTTVELFGCEEPGCPCAPLGVVSVGFRKSAALEWVPWGEDNTVTRHRDGLVWFGGAR